MAAWVGPAIGAAGGIISSIIGKPKQDPASKAAAEFQRWLLNRARAADPAMEASIAAIAQQAGYNYTPWTMGTPGTPDKTVMTTGGGINPIRRTQTIKGTPGTKGTAGQLTRNPNWNPMMTKDYQNQKAGFVAPLQAQRNAALAAGNNQAARGIYTRGGSGQNLDQQMAKALGGFNRDYYTNAEELRRQYEQALFGMIAARAQGGQEAAQSLAQIGADRSRQNAEYENQMAAALAPFFAQLAEANWGGGGKKATPIASIPSVTGQVGPVAYEYDPVTGQYFSRYTELPTLPEAPIPFPSWMMGG